MVGDVVCPECGSVMVEAKGNFQFGMIELYDVSVMRCPKCGKERYTGEQMRDIMKALNDLDMGFLGLNE